MEAYKYVRQIDRTGKIADSRNHRMQNAATTLLCDTIQKKRDFAPPFARLTSKVLRSRSEDSTAISQCCARLPS